FHWVDPAVGWAKVADVLRPDGTFALITYTGFSPLDAQIHAVWTAIAPETATTWALRERATLFDGIEARLGNISDAWAWLTQREPLPRPEAAELFHDVRLTTVETAWDETAESLVGFMRTTSSYLALEPDRQQRLEERLNAVVDEAGGSYPLT